MIEVKHLEKTYKGIRVLKNITCKIEKKDKVAIIGPSGAGKSTFLRCLNLLERPDSGKIFLDGVEITDEKVDLKEVRQKMNMVFQYFNLFENKTVLENITLAPIKLKNVSKEKATIKALELLDKVGLKSKRNYKPRQLSGGQKQRIAILRSIAMNPKVILFDEPTSSLDPEMTDEVLKVIKDLTKSDITLICVTHEINFAKSMANKIIFMDKCSILKEGSPEEIFNCEDNERIKNFLTKSY